VFFNCSGQLMTQVKDLELRVLVPAEAPDLAALEAAVFDNVWDEQRFSTLLGQGSFIAVGAFQGNALCGYITAYNMGGEAEIVNLAVRQDLRGRAVGGTILRYFLDQCSMLGVGRVVLDVRRGNRPALTLYAKCGFMQVGLRRNYYADSGEDALILERFL